jgi:hypothetical protein
MNRTVTGGLPGGKQARDVFSPSFGDGSGYHRCGRVLDADTTLSSLTMRYLRIPLVLLTALVSACGSSATSSSFPAPTTTDVSLDQQFTLAPGQTARIPGQGLSVRFDSVTGDSRCPIDAVCVWAGDATVRLTITTAQGSRAAVVHSTLEPRAVQAGAVRIAFVSLLPATNSARPIAPRDYRVQLQATIGS